MSDLKNDLYHVIVKKEESDKFEVWFSDLCEDELIKIFVNKYKKGTKIYHLGKILDPSQIVEVIICHSKQALDVEIEKLNDKSFEDSQRSNKEINRNIDGIYIGLPPHVYSRYEIKDYAENVTDIYLNNYVGSESEPGIISKTFKHPFVVQHFKLLVLVVIVIVIYVFYLYQISLEWFK